ncbi:hypothetical protein DNTS_011972, partial [Danionella cerebrum]
MSAEEREEVKGDLQPGGAPGDPVMEVDPGASGILPEDVSCRKRFRASERSEENSAAGRSNEGMNFRPLHKDISAVKTERSNEWMNFKPLYKDISAIQTGLKNLRLLIAAASAQTSGVDQDEEEQLNVLVPELRSEKYLEIDSSKETSEPDQVDIEQPSRMLISGNISDTTEPLETFQTSLQINLEISEEHKM